MTLRHRTPVGRRRPRLPVGNTDDHASGIRCDIDAYAVWFDSAIGPPGRETNQPRRIRPLGVSTGIAVAVGEEAAGLEGFTSASPGRDGGADATGCCRRRLGRRCSWRRWGSGLWTQWRRGRWNWWLRGSGRSGLRVVVAHVLSHSAGDSTAAPERYDPLGVGGVTIGLVRPPRTTGQATKDNLDPSPMPAGTVIWASPRPSFTDSQAAKWRVPRE